MSSWPLLISVVPLEGFVWNSTAGTPFLSSKQSRDTVRAMAKAGSSLDRDTTTQYIAEMFNRATELVGELKACEPKDWWRVFEEVNFWEVAGRRTDWTKSIDGRDLYQLSLKIMSARQVFLGNIGFLAEYHHLPEDQKENVKTTFNAANAAVDEFMSACWHHDGMYPQWVIDSDNEGDEESTKRRTQQRFAKIQQEMNSKNEPRARHEQDKDDEGDIKMSNAAEQVEGAIEAAPPVFPGTMSLAFRPRPQ
ncbi:hypothetical protein F5Y04DRAFT_287308 [Hypomontagnella monticulosa]|nr:hypothetical protein F5Y04DRAFT_287308 [Hypomontagnella monticulosa]